MKFNFSFQSVLLCRVCVLFVYCDVCPVSHVPFETFIFNYPQLLGFVLFFFSHLILFGISLLVLVWRRRRGDDDDNKISFHHKLFSWKVIFGKMKLQPSRITFTWISILNLERMRRKKDKKFNILSSESAWNDLTFPVTRSQANKVLF